MAKDIILELTPENAANSQLLLKAVANKLGMGVKDVGHYTITRRSIDSRHGKVRVNLGIRVFDRDEPIADGKPQFTYGDVSKSPPVAVIGAGPAGLFAALRLIEHGYKPIVVERGKEVSARKRDVALLNREHKLNPDSNYAFGEGGAGTFSDGKLYTRSRKRGDYNRVLYILCNHGASEDILFDSHPHIGTNRLPGIIVKIREKIISYGGEILYNSRVESIKTDGSRVTGVKLSDGRLVEAKACILATGHSARDVYSMLLNQQIQIEAKPFAMGVRVEHPQAIIDSIQYHGTPRGDYLPAASYSLVQQVEGRGVYSFCMCPGGFIVPAATEPNEVVVNGMSPSLRNSRWANSGIVVEVRLDDLKSYSKYGELAGVEYQHYLEELASLHGGFGVKAPAQRLVDFVDGNYSASLPSCSYHPGITSSELHAWLPDDIGFRLRKGFRVFGARMKGFLTNEAVVLGVESRTSSPVRIPRNPETLQHVGVEGLFPAGEGAGYAGGIVSSAFDGERCADAVAFYLGG